MYLKRTGSMYLKLSAVMAVGVMLGMNPAMAGGDLSPPPDQPAARRCGSGPFNGPYIGVAAGYANVGSNQESVQTGATLSDDGGGATVGGLAGYNLQCGRFVIGIETDINWLDADTSATLANQTFSTSYDYFGTLRGRVGITHENIMLYFTGGLAYAGLEHSLDAPRLGIDQSDRATKLGYTIGGGLELSRGHWSLRGEVLYVDLRDTTIDYTATLGCGTRCASTVRWEDDFVVGRVGLTFKLHRDEPVPVEPLK